MSPHPIPWSSTRQWRRLNQQMRHAARKSRHASVDLAAQARNISARIADLDPLLDRLCHQTCPHCPDICCLNARIWYDPRDLYYLHLCNHRIPSRQPLKHTGQVCRFASPRGCRLPRIRRPWVCTWYLCPPQQQRLHHPGRSAQKNRIDQTFEAVKQLRKHLQNDLKSEWTLPCP